MTEASYKQLIKEKFLAQGLDEVVLPELGAPKKGKVRDIYKSGENLLMITNDRVSAFDYVLPNLIPFKGQVLNAISEWAMDATSDIVPNALVSSPDPSVVVQKKMKNLDVECIVRGYLWGSMAAAYEKGERNFCGLTIPDGLVRYQKLDEVLFTPTTKAPMGQHDENMTYEEVETLVGKDIAVQLKDLSMKLFARGCELMKKQGLLLLDTKYEFGVDENGVLHVIDEVNTPDSSRMCGIEEYETKWPKVEAAMKEGGYKNVSELLKQRPDLKIKEYSKQYVRDTLLDLGFDGSEKKISLAEEHIVECSYRYISVYEKITGNKFAFPSVSSLTQSPSQRLVSNLKSCGFLSSGVVAIFAGSDSDMPHLEKLAEAVKKITAGSEAKVATLIRICSAHKQPTKLEKTLRYYNSSSQPMVIIACAGGTDALSGTAAFLSNHPIVSCPPDGLENKTCITNPPGSSNTFCPKPANAARLAVQMLVVHDPALGACLLAENAKKVQTLEKADKELNPQDGSTQPSKASKTSSTSGSPCDDFEYVWKGDSREVEYKKQIANFINSGLDEVFLPELGDAKQGKVRSIYFQEKNVLMITNDRVSAFDKVLPNLIPFKGEILNKISEWAFAQTSDIVPNALVASPDPSVVVQKKMKNLNVEFIVRGYLWGSMAAAYEKGSREFCGINLPDNLIRYQKLDDLLFTPTTKAEVGHDENMTEAEVEAFIGKDMAKKAKETAIALFKRGTELMAKQGLILLDTKYEFGLDEDGVLHVIDEVNTPDSSRMCGIEEYESKWPKVESAMKAGGYKNVSELLKAQPELKVKEYSKQYVRDTLLELGFDGEKEISLQPEQIVECSFRYIDVYEKITGYTFEFPSGNTLTPQRRLVKNLQTEGYLSAGVVCIMAGSNSDMPHLEKLRDAVIKTSNGTVCPMIRICSAHKQPDKLFNLLAKFNTSAQPVCAIGCAGGTDALSGTASFLAVFPVISCPPDGLINSTCVTNPPGSSNGFTASVSNATKCACQVLAYQSKELSDYLSAQNEAKIKKLEKADDTLNAIAW